VISRLFKQIFGAELDKAEPGALELAEGARAAQEALDRGEKLPMVLFPPAGTLELVCYSCLDERGRPATAGGSPDTHDASVLVQSWFRLHPPPDHHSEANYSPDRRERRRS
jgi:hypothetical protein